MPHIYDKATGLCLVCDRAELAAIREGKKFKRNNYDLRKTAIDQMTDREDPNYRNIINRHYVRDNNVQQFQPPANQAKNKYFIDDDPDHILSNNNYSTSRKPVINPQSSRQNKPQYQPNPPKPITSNRRNSSSGYSTPGIDLEDHIEIPHGAKMVTAHALPPRNIIPLSSRSSSRSKLSERPIVRKISPSRLLLNNNNNNNNETTRYHLNHYASSSSNYGDVPIVRQNGNIYYYSDDYNNNNDSADDLTYRYRGGDSRLFQRATSPNIQVVRTSSRAEPKKTYMVDENGDRIQYVHLPSMKKKILIHHHYE